MYLFEPDLLMTRNFAQQRRDFTLPCGCKLESGLEIFLNKRTANVRFKAVISHCRHSMYLVNNLKGGAVGTL